MKISAVIIAFNEEEKIAEAVNSVSWADEVLLVDSESTDNTRDIAANLGAKVIVQRWPGFSKQKQFAVDAAEHDWIFSLDADECVSDKLKHEILSLKAKDCAEIADGYKIPRLSIYMNRPIRHCGWYPDWQLRFFNRKKGRWADVLIHESFQLEENARLSKLAGDILHYSVTNAAHHYQMIGERYAPLGAAQMFAKGKTTSPLKIAFSPFWEFFRAYFLKAGFLDGFPGFCISFFAAQHTFLKHLLLYEKLKGNTNSK